MSIDGILFAGKSRPDLLPDIVVVGSTRRQSLEIVGFTAPVSLVFSVPTDQK
jgi:hypothetical protein